MAIRAAQGSKNSNLATLACQCIFQLQSLSTETLHTAVSVNFVSITTACNPGLNSSVSQQEYLASMQICMW